MNTHLAQADVSITWKVSALSAPGWPGGTSTPNTWIAEFGAGYLVLHTSPTGNESVVYVPHAVSGLGPADLRLRAEAAETACHHAMQVISLLRGNPDSALTAIQIEDLQAEVAALATVAPPGEAAS